MATVISEEEAFAHSVELISRALRGEEIVIAHEGQPRLKLVPVKADDHPRRGRRLGAYGGRVKEAPGVWDPMTDEELREIGLL